MKAEAVCEISKPVTKALSLEAKFFLILSAYFCWQVLLRTLTSNTADLDEAEQLVLTQKLQWGYGPQPPLYTWLQILFFEMIGHSIFALALLKNLLLFGTYSFTYLSARELTRNQRLAVTAAVSLLFVPQIAWESQRDLTHSVLVTMLAAATVFVFLRLTQTRQTRLYLAFGVCAGLGALANYSYLVFFAGFALSALSVPRVRTVLLDQRAALAFLLAVALTLPHAHWAISHPAVVFATSYKFQIQSSNDWAHSFLGGISHLAGAVVVHVGALLSVYLLVGWKQVRSFNVLLRRDDAVRLLGGTYLIVLSGLILAIMFFQVTGFKDRWFQPVFVSLPVFLVALFRERIGWEAFRATMLLGGVVAVVVSITIPARLYLAESLNRDITINAPFDKFAAELRTSAFHPRLIFTETLWMGGNMRLRFPDVTVLMPRVRDFPYRLQDGDQCLVVWNATRSMTPPEKLVQFVNSFSEIKWNPADPPQYVEVLLKHHHHQTMRFGIITGRCHRGEAMAPSRQRTSLAQGFK